jgi:hypothetical protein
MSILTQPNTQQMKAKLICKKTSRPGGKSPLYQVQLKGDLPTATTPENAYIKAVAALSALTNDAYDKCGYDDEDINPWECTAWKSPEDISPDVDLQLFVFRNPDGLAVRAIGTFQDNHFTVAAHRDTFIDPKATLLAWRAFPYLFDIPGYVKSPAKGEEEGGAK